MKTITKLSDLTETQKHGEQIDANIDLEGVKKLPDGITINATGYIYLRSLTTLPEGVTLTAGGHIDLLSLTTLPEGVTLTAGGHIYLLSLTTLPEGVTLTAGGDIDLRSLTTLPEGVTLTAGGYIDLKREWVQSKTRPDPMSPVLLWPRGEYACADGILMRVSSRRGNVYRGRVVGTNKPVYLITDGQKCAHGATLAEAKADLVYKVSGKKPEDYRHLKLGSRLSFADAVACYRTVTGACAFGVRSFVDEKSINKDATVTPKNILAMTKGRFGHEAFARFFGAPA